MFLKKKDVSDVTRDAFRGYVFGTIYQWRFFKDERFSDDNFKEGFEWAINIIDHSFEIVANNKTAGYKQKGCFSVYEDQPLTFSNAIFMDMFEVLLFVENCQSVNNAKIMPEGLAEDMKIKLWSISYIFQQTSQNMVLAKYYEDLKRNCVVDFR